ncbi:MAG: 2,3-bisphosphoglycerate-independent phosphoglycerate mutase [Planctomycetaceae bacterium]|nr:2,3-bisphosphoglycerate-independent phosphoglycerate mutase [Planctomycetaceae bacterium]
MAPVKVNPVLLVILDGWGVAPPSPGNAIELAQPPCFMGLWRNAPHTTLVAGDEDVGLPQGQFGNSEVGHMNLGAGRVVYQEITRIDRDIREGRFFQLEALKKALAAKTRKARIHLMGLVSDGGVHSMDRHYFALLDWLKQAGVSGGDVCFHVITDGRDTSPQGGVRYVQALRDKLDALGMGRIATLCGRYYAMDRDKRWERTEKYYNAITLGDAEVVNDPVAALEQSYAQGITDEFVPPKVVVEHGQPLGRVMDGDIVLWFNFRADRARQICRALTLPQFDGFKRKMPVKVTLVTMTRYESGLPALVCYEPQSLTNVLGDYLAQKGLAQFRCAETEKYAHVTYFFNGGREQPFDGEERKLVPSPKVATYDLQPEMSAPEVTSSVEAAIASGRYAFVLVNYANPDMTGHTGVLEAGIKGVLAADRGLGALISAAEARGYAVLVTADHGNADEMLVSPEAAADPANQEKGAAYAGPKGVAPRADGLVPSTNHSHNPVPLILAGRHGPLALAPGGRLADVAPTVLELMGLPKPQEMTGRSLLLPVGN